MGGFNFDLSAMNPMLNALGAYLPQLLASKAEEARLQPQRTQQAYRQWLNSKMDENNRANIELDQRVKGQQAAQALADRTYSDARKDLTDERTRSEMARRYAETSPDRDEANYGSIIGGPQATSYQRMASRLDKYAGVGRGVGNYTGLTDMANAMSGASAAATNQAGENLRDTAAPDRNMASGASCPPGYVVNGAGGCSFAGARR